jgi:predicted DNA-binding transcriptional regulator YafY
MKLIQKLNGLITEIAAISDITNSIKKREIVTIYYDGKDNGGKGYRTIEPVCLGMSKKNNMVLRAWESEGSSFSAKNKGNFLPGWRLFRVDKIFTYKPTFDKFNEMRPNYNQNGDKSMIQVLVNTKFDN